MANIAKEISEILVYPDIKTIKSVIKGVKEALNNDCEYDAKHKEFTKEECRKIQAGSYKEHLCTTLIEHGNS